VVGLNESVKRVEFYQIGPLVGRGEAGKINSSLDRLRSMLKKLLERSELVIIIPVITLFLSAIVFGVYGAYLTIETGIKFFTTPEQREVVELVSKFLSVIDMFLLAMVLYIFALGLYELFVGKLNIPAALSIESVDELKAKLASVIILFVAIAYVKLLVDWKDPVETLLFGAATGILMAVLIQYYKAKEGHGG
jgi:uncharacterized membrane protein YqhA